MESRADYKKRMLQTVAAFHKFGLKPQWRPGKGDIEGFCHDEVVRQHHDTSVWEDGGVRVAGMVRAWEWARGIRAYSGFPNIGEIHMIGKMIEPDYNRDGFRHENVYVGSRMGVFPPHIQFAVQYLARRAPEVEPGLAGAGFVDHLMIEAFDEQVKEIKTVDEWYLAYEWIHPFRDGNGRSGKVLYNWLNKTMEDPVLVHDYFGFNNP